MAELAHTGEEPEPWYFVCGDTKDEGAYARFLAEKIVAGDSFTAKLIDGMVIRVVQGDMADAWNFKERRPPGRKEVFKMVASGDYYARLGVQHGASQEEIKTAYKKLALKYHPDRHQGNDLRDLADEKLKEINEAYQALSSGREAPPERERSRPQEPRPGPAASRRSKRHDPSPVAGALGFWVFALVFCWIPFLGQWLIWIASIMLIKVIFSAITKPSE